MEELSKFFRPGLTSVLVASSGVGKSTMINQLTYSANQKTQVIREEDAKGRHTTTSRTMLKSKFGGLIIDTPGMRSFGLSESDSAGSGLFDDIIELEGMCRFPNCTHTAEPDCALLKAIETNLLDERSLISFYKLKKEEAFNVRKESKVEASNAKKRWKNINMQMRKHYKKIVPIDPY